MERKDNLGLKGKYTLEILRKDGSVELVNIDNSLSNAGKTAVLDIMFNSATQITNWYTGIIDNSGYTGIDLVNDTMASHSGWTEFTSYDETTRVQWSPGASASQSSSNSTAMVFNVNATGTLKGMFIVSSSTKSGTAGTLFSMALFASTVSVVNGDQFKITYTVSA